MQAVQFLIPRFPVPPDYVQCNPHYGTVSTSDCEVAGQALPRGGQAIRYHTGAPEAHYRLPFSVTHSV